VRHLPDGIDERIAGPYVHDQDHDAAVRIVLREFADAGQVALHEWAFDRREEHHRRRRSAEFGQRAALPTQVREARVDFVPHLPHACGRGARRVLRRQRR
jgi:hypothetical protein